MGNCAIIAIGLFGYGDRRKIMILRGYVLSKVLEMETGITVVIPNTIKPAGSYRTAYLLHGLYGSSGNWADFTMLPVYADKYDVIFIMPEVARSFYTDMKYGLRYFTYVTEELPRICESIFNISSRREDTAVIGASMGGYGALKCALSRPEQYGYCCAFSSACLFLKEGLDKMRSAEGRKECKDTFGEQLFRDFVSMFGEQLEWDPRNEILELAKKLDVQQIKPKIYSACGAKDSFLEDNSRFAREMKKLSFDFTYEEWQGYHDWYFFNEALQKALRICFRDYV